MACIRHTLPFVLSYVSCVVGLKSQEKHAPTVMKVASPIFDLIKQSQALWMVQMLSTLTQLEDAIEAHPTEFNLTHLDFRKQWPSQKPQLGQRQETTVGLMGETVLEGPVLKNVRLNISKVCQPRDNGHLMCMAHLGSKCDVDVNGSIHTILNRGDRLHMKAASKISGLPFGLDFIMPASVPFELNCMLCGSKCAIDMRNTLKGLDLPRIIHMVEPVLTGPIRTALLNAIPRVGEVQKTGFLTLEMPPCPVPVDLDAVAAEKDVGVGDGLLDQMPAMLRQMIMNLRIDFSLEQTLTRSDGSMGGRFVERLVVGKLQTGRR